MKANSSKRVSNLLIKYWKSVLIILKHYVWKVYCMIWLIDKMKVWTWPKRYFFPIILGSYEEP